MIHNWLHCSNITESGNFLVVGLVYKYYLYIIHFAASPCYSRMDHLISSNVTRRIQHVRVRKIENDMH